MDAAISGVGGSANGGKDKAVGFGPGADNVPTAIAAAEAYTL